MGKIRLYLGMLVLVALLGVNFPANAQVPESPTSPVFSPEKELFDAWAQPPTSLPAPVFSGAQVDISSSMPLSYQAFGEGVSIEGVEVPLRKITRL